MMRLVFVLLCCCLSASCAHVTADGFETRGAEHRQLGSPEQQDGIRDRRTLPTAIAWVLFGGVALIMTAFYFVNYTNVDIVDATWLVMSNAISLFCAVLFFLAFRELVALITDGEDIQDRRLGSTSGDSWTQCWPSHGDHRRLSHLIGHRRLAGVPTQKTLTVDALCVIFMFVAWEALLLLVRSRGSSLPAFGLIGAHCIGFSALYAFGNMQQCAPFRESAGLSFVIAIAALVVVTLLCCIGDLLRRSLANGLGAHEAHSARNWLHQCAHTEREALAFAVSFLLAQVLQFIATDNLAPLHDVPKGRDPGDAVAEFCFVALLAVSVVAAGYAEQVIANRCGHGKCVANEHGHEMSRSQLGMHVVKDTLAFTLGWSLLTLVKLTFWSATNDTGILGGGDVMTSHVVIVFISSAITFGTFFIIDFSANRVRGHFGRGLRSLGKAFMLLLGLAWEGAFWEGAHSMSEGMHLEDKGSRMMVVISSSFLFCAIVMPAWILYIVPHSVELKNDDLHIKDYDDHVSFTSGTTTVTMKTHGASTIPSQTVVEEASGSTCDDEVPPSTPSSPHSSVALPDPFDATALANVQATKLAPMDGQVRGLVSL